MSTDRVKRLLAKVEEGFRLSRLHMRVDPAAQTAFARLALASADATRFLPEVERKARFLETFAADMPVTVRDDELIVGDCLFGFRGHWLARLTEEERRRVDFHGNNGHVVVDYGRVLALGVAGLERESATMPRGDDRQRRNADACQRALRAFATFVRRHADAAESAAKGCGDRKRRADLERVAQACARLATGPATSFHDALQQTWFVQLFLHAEGGGAAVSFGRFDQYVGPYLERDLADGVLTLAQAEELLACFWLKACEGDESQNFVVGGGDAAGKSAENHLSRLCLKVCRQLRVWQPSVSVRLGPGSSDAFWHDAVALAEAGFGMPSFFNDPVVSRALEAAGVPGERAWDYGIVGCYEATPQGDTQAYTVNGCLSLPDVFLAFFRQETAAASFPTYLEAWPRFLAGYYAGLLQTFQRTWNDMAAAYPSPFEAVCLTGCPTSGLTSAEGGAKHNLFGVNVMGLGTLVDSLYAIKALVFDRRELTLADLQKDVAANFPDAARLARIRSLPGRYGSDSAETNTLVAGQSRLVTDLVLNSRLANGVRPYPAFFRFGGDIGYAGPATPDGRRDGERCSYGVGPGIYTKGASLISILSSAAKVCHDRCGCGNPLTISFNRGDIQGEKGRARLRQVIETYFRLGGFHLQINVVDADQLRAAKAAPGEHLELTVRISGFSAHFVSLGERWQDAIIERTERGM